MRKLILIVCLLSLTIGTVVAASEKTKIGWTNPTTYTDGTSIGSAVITNKIYCGVISGTYTKTTLISQPSTSALLSTVSCTTNGTNYFTVTAIVANQESAKCTEGNVIASGGKFYDTLPVPEAPSGGCSFF